MEKTAESEIFTSLRPRSHGQEKESPGSEGECHQRFLAYGNVYLFQHSILVSNIGLAACEDVVFNINRGGFHTKQQPTRRKKYSMTVCCTCLIR